MTSKEFEKGINNSRKIVGSRFGFKKSGYVSYKVVDGYFFYILHLVDTCVYLEVKPLYADDLWWDIFETPDNKKPLSLRGRGAFALSGERIGEYQTFEGDWKNYTEQDFEKIWTSVFNKIEAQIAEFLSQNPSADQYMPPERYRGGNVSLLYLMTLLHNNKESEVIDLVSEALKNNRSSEMSKWTNGKIVDGYSFILKYANSLIKQNGVGRLRRFWNQIFD